MAMPAGAAALTSPPFDLDGRNFALLNRAERDELRAVLQPLAWIDGLVTAVILAREEPEDWMEYIWLPGELGNLTASQSVEVSSVVDDHLVHVAGTLCDDPEAYRPYLGGAGGRMEAAAQWAAGFRFGIRLPAEPWGPLIANDDARSLLAAIFSLERDEDLPEEERADSPFRDMPADRREHMRRTTLQILPQVVLALHDHALGVCEVEEGARSGEEPYVRAAPRIGRNDPCSCGSGKKYKRCCLGA